MQLRDTPSIFFVLYLLFTLYYSNHLPVPMDKDAFYDSFLQPSNADIVIYCHPDIDDLKLQSIENTIKSHDLVKSYRIISKKETFIQLEKLLGEDATVLEGMGEDFLPVTFYVKLSIPFMRNDFIKEWEGDPRIEKIHSPSPSLFNKYFENLFHSVNFLSSRVTTSYLSTLWRN